MVQMVDKLRQILLHCQDVGDLAGFSFGEDGPDGEPIGFVESVGLTTVCISAVNESGELDGKIICHLEDIERLAVGSRELNTARLLHENLWQAYGSGQEEHVTQFKAELPGSLAQARDKRLLVTVTDYDNNSTVGFVTDLGEDWLEIEAILADGTSDGFVVMGIDDILRVYIGGKREQAAAFVHQKRLGR